MENTFKETLAQLEKLKQEISDKVETLRSDYRALEAAITVLKTRQVPVEISNEIDDDSMPTGARKLPAVVIPVVPPEDREQTVGDQELNLSKIPTNHIVTRYSVRFKRSDKLKLFKVEKREHKHILMCFNEAGEFESEVNLKEYAQDICSQVRQKIYNHKTAGDKVHISDHKHLQWLMSN